MPYEKSNKEIQDSAFKMEGFSGFGEGASPAKFHKSGMGPGDSRGLHLFGPSKRRTKTRKNIIKSTIEKITDSDWNQNRIKKKAVRKKIKSERKSITKVNKLEKSNTGWSNPRTLPSPGSSKIY